MGSAVPPLPLCDPGIVNKATSLIGCMTLGPLVPLSEPRFPHTMGITACTPSASRAAMQMLLSLMSSAHWPAGLNHNDSGDDTASDRSYFMSTYYTAGPRLGTS